MPEPMEMPNIEAIVETIRVARRSEEGARMHISISVQVKDAPQLLPFLATSLKNVVKVGFTEIQARLPENPPKVDTVTITTSVDGEPAKVVLPRSRRNGHKADPDELAAQGAMREAAMQEAGKTRHAFVANDSADTCDLCGRAAEADAHAGVEEGDLPPPAQYLVDAAKETEAVPS